MHKKARSAFTLIEVMVAVMIISVVILALLEMFANNIRIFSQLNKQTNTNQYASFLIANSEYGLETKKVTLDALLSDFKLDSDLQRELKSVKTEVIYQIVEQIDLSKYGAMQTEKIKQSEREEIQSAEKESNKDIIFEIGKTILQTEEASTALLRVRIEQ